MITAKVITDSVSPNGIRITTMILTYPRYIHAEFMTHRVFSRNAGSSRAIPVAKLLHWIKDLPAIPIHWGENQKGMQASKELTGWRRWALEFLWHRHRRISLHTAWMMSKLGGHKQLVNRVIENHGHINVLVTSTKWENFRILRDSKMAMPEIEALAKAVMKVLKSSKPIDLKPGDWHLPFVKYEEKVNLPLNERQLISAARCARVSYLTVDGRLPDKETDLTLANTLMASMHMSPFEHQATPDEQLPSRYKKKIWRDRKLWGNFHGWVQFRKTLTLEALNEGDEIEF